VNQESPSGSMFSISYATMRKFVGWLGLSLPFILPAGFVIFFSRHGFPESISGYYYTGMRNYLVAALCVLGALFIAYNAYKDRLDFWITNLAGIFAVCVAFFPTSPAAASPHQQDIGHIHFVFAGLLFAMLAIMALRFTKTNPDGDRTSQKSRRDVIYSFCAALIAASMLVAFITNFLPTAVKQNMPSLFWFEAIAVVAFSVSWLVKGAAFPVLNDKPSAAVQPQPEPSTFDTSANDRTLAPGATSA
jgi:cytochrome bd-type quinol oxidase subunit 2